MHSDDKSRPEDAPENDTANSPETGAETGAETGTETNIETDAENASPASAEAAESKVEAEAEAEVEAEAEEPSTEARLAAANDQILRTLAELENTRKRAARDRAEALKFGAMSFARDMLSVADNFQRALKAVEDMQEDVPEAMRGLLDGISATQRDLMAALARHKVTPLTPMGEKFDPNLHEAMFEAPGTGQASGTIIEVIEAGYMMEERLLRPAKVGIAKD
jgi:molecular chaperone GrpE